MSLSINGYNEEQFRKYLTSAPYYDVIQQMIAAGIKISYKKINNLNYNFISVSESITPREYYLTPECTLCSLYYVDYLAALSPDRIYDFGCGINFHKRFYPNIHGIDPYSPYADEKGTFDEDYSKNHTNAYQCAMALGSLHYTSLVNLKKSLLDFINIIKPGGRGCVIFNTILMVIETTEEETISLFGKLDYTNSQLADYCNQIIKELPVKLLVVDNLIEEEPNEHSDGNLRIVFEKL